MKNTSCLPIAFSFVSIRIWLMVSTLVAGTATATAEPDYYFKQFSLKDGLTQTTVHAVFRDTQGFLWIGTGAGLNRFDGQNLKRYFSSDSATHSLPGNRIHYITEDAQKNLWISTGGGVALYDRVADRFTLQKTNDSSFISNAFCLLPDGMVCTATGALYKYEYNSAKWKKLPMKSEQTIRFNFNGAVAWDNGKLLLSSRHNGLYIYDLKTGQLIRAPFYAGKTEIRKIFSDSKRRLWISPYGAGLQLYSYSGKPTAEYTTQNSGLNNNVILDIIERNGNIWIATDGGGINILNPETATFSYIRNVSENASSFPAKAILSLYQDSWDCLWAGSVRQGLIQVKEVHMKTYRHTTFGSPYGLSNETVVSLLEDTDGAIWVGTDGGGINKLNPKTGTVEHFKTTDSDKVISIAQSKNNELLISIFGKGFFFFNKTTGAKRQLLIMNEAEDSRISKSGYAATTYTEDGERFMILSDNIYSYNHADKTFTTVYSQRKDIQSGILNCLSGDYAFRYLFDSHHIFRMQDAGRLEALFSVPEEKMIYAAAIDKQGIIWIGADDGLIRLDSKTNGAATRIPLSSDRTVTALACDNQQRLWIGSRGTLSVYYTLKNRFEVFNETDGVIPNEFIFRPTLISHTGDIFMGGVSGLLYINKNIPPYEITLPTMRLTGVFANDKDQKQLYPSLETGASHGVPHIRTAWNNSSVTIQVMACEKDIFRTRHFRYTIDGLSQPPLETDNQNLTLQSLPSGSYTVLVSCSLPDGTWSLPEKMLQLSVMPPWWKSSWFLLIFTVFALALAAFGVLVFSRKKEYELQSVIQEREKQVNEDKVRFLINVSHELRTPLTLIYSPLKRMLAALPEREELRAGLSNIYKQAAHMKHIINMVLDMRKVETGNEQMFFRPHVLHDWMKEVADYFVDEMKQRNLLLEYSFDEQVSEVWFDSQKCEIVLSNFLSNALKFGQSGDSVLLATQANVDTQTVRISVSDKGEGLAGVDPALVFSPFYQGDNAQGGSGIGLAFSKTLVEMHGGIIGAENNAGGGATFYFEIPIRQSNAGGAFQPVTPAVNELFSDKSGITAGDNFDTHPFDAGRYSLLIVEDNAELLQFLKQSFRHVYKTIYTATNGEDALGIVKRQNPDIVVSDIVMPRMDGFTLCRHIKSNIDISHIPVVLLTSRNDTDNVQLGYKLGADGYVGKPFDVEFLQIVLANQLKMREQIKARYKEQNALLQPEEVTFSNADEQFMLRMNKLIEDNLDNPKFNVALIAAEIGMSRASLYNKMKDLLNIGVNDYVNRVRLEKAAALLARPDIAIADVAVMVGFSSQRYFSTAFKQYKGMTPSEFRGK